VLSSGILAKGLILAIAVACLWLFFRYFEWKSIYYPTRRIMMTPADAGLEYEDVQFVAEDGVELHGWWIPGEKGAGAILYCHGNAGNIGDRVPLLSDLHQLGQHLFIFDYRGYGKSRGMPTETGTYRDSRAAYEVVRARFNDVDEPPVVAYGRSLGAAVAAQVALDKPVKGLIMESGFPSVPDMAAHLYPFLPIHWLSRFRYDSLSKVRVLMMPKLFAHSREDEIVPYELGQKLYAAAAEPKSFVEVRGGHNEVAWALSSAYWAALEAFIHRVLEPQRRLPAQNEGPVYPS